MNLPFQPCLCRWIACVSSRRLQSYCVLVRVLRRSTWFATMTNCMPRWKCNWRRSLWSIFFPILALWCSGHIPSGRGSRKVCLWTLQVYWASSWAGCSTNFNGSSQVVHKMPTWRVFDAAMRHARPAVPDHSSLPLNKRQFFNILLQTTVSDLLMRVLVPVGAEWCEPLAIQSSTATLALLLPVSSTMIFAEL